MSITQYEFEMLSDPQCLQFYREDTEEDGIQGIPIRNYSRIFFTDSIFTLFPLGEIYYKDHSGLISDKVFFVEGLEFKAKLGYEKTEETLEDGTVVEDGGYLEHEYVWSESQFNNVQISNALSGDIVFLLLSKYYKDDHPKCLTFNHENHSQFKTISQILKEDILPSWGFLEEKYKDTISDTVGTPYLNQLNMTNRQFIKLLAEYSYSQNFVTSGFYTFINCNGEFYYMTIQEMLNQPSVMKYKIDLTESMTIDKNIIKDYTILHGGLPVNKENYNRKFFHYGPDGEVVTEDKHIQDSVSDVSTLTKLLVRKQYIPATPSDVKYMGILSSIDTEMYNGYKNYFYRDTALCYRMVLVVQFDHKLVSGKTVEIEIEKANNDNEIATEYSGKWLICESSHTINEEGIPYSQLVISKPKIQIDKDHVFYDDFVK